MSEQDGPPFVAIGYDEDPPWGDDRTCPKCGEPDLPLEHSDLASGIVLHFISHCEETWLRGPITWGA